jgi:streptogramin lyase
MVLVAIASGSAPYAGNPLKFLVGNATNNSILKYDGITGALLGVFVQPGSGGLNNPQNVIFGPDGNVYVSSWGNGSVLRYDGNSGAFIDAFVPSGTGGLSNPDQLAFGPDGNLYVSDRFSASIFRYNGSTGAFIDIPISDGRLGGFVGFTFGPDGKIYANEYNGHFDVLRCDPATHTCAVFASGHSLVSASGITFGPDGNLYVSGINSGNVVRYDGTTGSFIDVFVPTGRGGLVRGADYLIFGSDGNLYVNSQATHNTLRYDGTTGAFLDDFAAESGQGLPKGLAFVPTQHHAVVAFSAHRLTFEGRSVGTTSGPETVILTNIGKEPMTNFNILVEFGRDFAQTNNCPQALASMATCLVMVAFTPKGVGTRTGTLRLNDSSASGTHTVNLRGTGQ